MGRRSAVWVGGTAALLAAALTVFFLTGQPRVQAATIVQDYSRDISIGPKDARVVLVEYADFQCAACAGYAKLLAPLREEYKDRVLFVFRNYPLQNHEYSSISAKVAYAAYLQGRFWEMHDLLYQRQREWAESDDPRPYFDTYATGLGLDVGRLHQDADADTTRDFVNGQAREAVEGGINHTPWFFLNGQTIQATDAAAFRTMIEDRL